MKISEMKFNCRRDLPVSGEHCADFSLFFFRAPVSFRCGGREKTINSASVIIYRNNSLRFFRSADGNTLIYDSISFRPTPSEYQNVCDMEIAFDTPIALGESVIIRNLLKCMQDFSAVSGNDRSDFYEGALNLIITCIAEQINNKEREDKYDIPHYAKLRELRERIYNNPSLRWNIDEICAELAMSRTYFHRIYLAAFGVSCIQDVIDSRIAYASRMLTESEMSVSRIAEYCGYDSDSFFMRQFKKSTGLTPSEYRKRFSEQ